MSKKNINQSVCSCSTCSCDDLIHHISRIEGQLKKLKEYMKEGEQCEKVAMLSSAITNSFNSLKRRTLKNFIFNLLIKNKNIPVNELEAIEKILDLYKK